jgi:hypothetical protein
MFQEYGQESERVREFKYLGSTLPEDITAEIEERSVMANQNSYGLKKQLCYDIYGERQHFLYIRRL